MSHLQDTPPQQLEGGAAESENKKTEFSRFTPQIITVARGAPQDIFTIHRSLNLDPRRRRRRRHDHDFVAPLHLNLLSSGRRRLVFITLPISHAVAERTTTPC